MHKFAYQDLEIHYKIEGKGKPIVFLHGFLENHSIWDSIVPSFKDEGYQCILIDLPCHGISRFKGAICAMEQMASIVNALFDKLKIEFTHLVGHSMGGYVALELNALRPSKVILLHSNFWSDDLQKKSDRNRVIEVVEKNKSLFIKEAIPNLFADENRIKCSHDIQKLINEAVQIPEEEIQAATAGMRDRKSFYKTSESSTLHIIHGEHDPIISTSKMTEEITLLKSNHELIVLKGVGHMSIWESSTLLINSLKSIISR